MDLARVEQAVRAALGAELDNALATTASLDAALAEDLGLDSFLMVEVALRVEDSLAVALDDELLADCRTLGDLVRAASDALRRRG